MRAIGWLVKGEVICCPFRRRVSIHSSIPACSYECPSMAMTGANMMPHEMGHTYSFGICSSSAPPLLPAFGPPGQLQLALRLFPVDRLSLLLLLLLLVMLLLVLLVQ